MKLFPTLPSFTSILMATRSRIGIQLGNCSFCLSSLGWLSSVVGSDTQRHYNTKEKVADLIDGGDMSTCAWTKDRWTGKKVAEYVTENVEVEEYGPQYYSQRGEDCPPRLDDSIFKFLDKDNNEEYAYIWTVNNNGSV